MGILIKAIGDKIRIGTTFLLGADRITVNDQEGFVGRLKNGVPVKFSIRTREYEVCRTMVNRLAGGLRAIDVRIYERGAVVFAGVYDDKGRQIESHDALKTRAGTHVFCLLGAVAGGVAMFVLFFQTGKIPSGYLCGSIGGMVGGTVGYWLGAGIFGGR